MAQRDDLSRTGETTRGENRSLVGLGAAVGEERLAHIAGRDPGEALGEGGLRLSRENR
jgi:hypothetical protein